MCVRVMQEWLPVMSMALAFACSPTSHELVGDGGGWVGGEAHSSKAGGVQSDYRGDKNDKNKGLSSKVVSLQGIIEILGVQLRDGSNASSVQAAALVSLSLSVSLSLVRALSLSLSFSLSLSLSLARSLARSLALSLSDSRIV